MISHTNPERTLARQGESPLEAINHYFNPFVKALGLFEELMTVFLSSFVNKIDKKGRVSVPASFRAALGSDAPGVVVFKSLQHDALDACSIAHLELLSQSLEKQDLPSDVFELIEATIFGGSVQLPFDGEGRIVIPQTMLSRIGIADEVAFVGRRKTFQIWNPEKLAAYENDARDKAKARNISLSKIIAQVSATENGGAK